MADTDVGKQGIYHSEDGDVPCTVIDYGAGRPSGDHLIEFTDGDDGAGFVKRAWRVAGTQRGAFELN